MGRNRERRSGLLLGAAAAVLLGGACSSAPGTESGAAADAASGASAPKPSVAAESGAAGNAAVEAGSAASESVEPTIIAWKGAFPRQAASEAANARMEASPTGYGGSEPFQRAVLMPELAVNFRGSPFAKDYKEDRGHVYAWTDLLETGRLTEKSPGACITCKTSDIQAIHARDGWAYAKRPLKDLVRELAAEPEAHQGIDCFSCHDPESKQLRAVQPGFLEAQKRRGIDLATAPQSAMMSYVCAQCHSEYYFEPGTTRVVHPWDRGLSAEAMYEYYAATPGGFAGDFTDPESGLSLLKAQHPDYEEYSAGTHGAAGVPCAACHLPRTLAEGESFSAHRVTSPLRTVKESCLTCHADKTEDYLLGRVKRIQDAVFRTQRLAGTALAEARDAYARATKAGLPAQKLAAAGEQIRKAQWLWDFVASANSMGFHDPVGVQANLATSIDLSLRARESLAALR